MTAAMGLRELKKERTRADIVRVAAQLFADRGFDDVTVEEIAAEAEVAQRTFYRYFATKEELVLGPLQRDLDDVTAALAQRPRSESVIASISAVIMDICERYERDLGNDRLRITLVRSTPSLQQRQTERQAAFEAVITPFVAERLGVDPNDDIRPTLLAGCTLAATRAATNLWLAGDPTLPLLPMVEHALSTLSRAFADV